MFGALECRAVRRLLIGSIGLIGYVFAGYPGIIAMLGRLRPRPVRTEAGHAPTVTLVIAAPNEADVIEDKLRNVRELDYPADRLEVIVAADGSDDATAELAGRVPGVRVLYRPER